MLRRKYEADRSLYKLHTYIHLQQFLQLCRTKSIELFFFFLLHFKPKRTILKTDNDCSVRKSASAGLARFDTIGWWWCCWPVFCGHSFHGAWPLTLSLNCRLMFGFMQYARIPKIHCVYYMSGALVCFD